MRLLLDTHIFLWFVNGDPRLSSKAKALIEPEENVAFVSIASLWEIAIKVNIGKLKLGLPYDVFISQQMKMNELRLLSIDQRHTEQIAILPLHTRDPFDRMLVAQAIVSKIPIVSADSHLDNYPITRLW
jgi:PIN domain nuclease of toxin-antitoxin system